jgi:hypothetical protein
MMKPSNSMRLFFATTGISATIRWSEGCPKEFRGLFTTVIGLAPVMKAHCRAGSIPTPVFDALELRNFELLTRLDQGTHCSDQNESGRCKIAESRTGRHPMREVIKLRALLPMPWRWRSDGEASPQKLVADQGKFYQSCEPRRSVTALNLTLDDF